MKKHILTGIATCLFLGTAAYAAQQNGGFEFAPQPWTSLTKVDVVKIQSSSRTLHNVQIYVDSSRDGIDVKNCGKVTHINSGSAAICELSPQNPIITFNSDEKHSTFGSRGTFQIDEK